MSLRHAPTLFHTKEKLTSSLGLSACGLLSTIDIAKRALEFNFVDNPARKRRNALWSWLTTAPVHPESAERKRSTSAFDQVTKRAGFGSRSEYPMLIHKQEQVECWDTESGDPRNNHNQQTPSAASSSTWKRGPPRWDLVAQGRLG
jgi:hypothetical protein